MTTTKASAKTNGDIAIQIDHDGTQFGKFNPNGDPIISHFKCWHSLDDDTSVRDPDEWVLSYLADDERKSQHLGTDDANQALTKAQEHLRSVSFTPQAAKLAEFGNEPEPTGW